MKKITFLLLSALSFTMLGQPSSTPPVPSEADADVVSVFSDAYTSTATLSLASFTPAGNTANIVSAAGNDVYEFTFSGGEFHGFDLSNALDLSSMENIHYDIWIEGTTQAGAVFNTTLSQHGGGHLTGQTAGYVDTNAITTGQEGMWLSFDIVLDETEFAGLTSVAPRDIISQIVFTSTNLSDTGPIYVDNIYFWKEAVDPNADATLSDLTLDGTTINGFAPGVLTYNVELPNGTTTAPTVAGVATQAGNGSSNIAVTQASGVPGSATLEVTAPNGTDTQTYTVNFTELPALPPAAPTPPTQPAVSIISDVYSNVPVPQIDVFGGTLTNYDLNSDGNEEARSLINGSGFQFNFFAGSFLDVSGAGLLHMDIYNDDFQASDVLTIRLIGSDNRQNIHRITNFDPADNGTWISVDLQLPDGDPASTDLGDFDESDSDANSIDLSSIGLIQFNTLENGSTLGNREFFFSNFYFYGGTLSTPENALTELKVSPNPSNNVWNINISNQQITSVQVFDILGKNVLSLEPNASEVDIDGTNFNKGIYMAKVATQNGSQTIKLIKN